MSDDREGRYECSICAYATTSEFQLAEHAKAHVQQQSPKFIVMLERKPRSGKRVVYIAKRVDEPLAAGNEIVAPQGVLYESFAVYNYVSEAVSRATELNG